TTLLDRHQIRYGKAGKNTPGVAVYDYATGSETKFNVAENDLIISAYQPKGLLAQVLFEPTAELVDSLTYDITAWSLPLAHGLDAYASKQRLDFTQGYPGDTYNNKVRSDGTTYAYLAPWNSFQSARFLSELLKKGIVVRFSEERFELNGKNYPAGTLVITRGDNRKNRDFEKTLAAAATKFSYDLTPVSTGFVNAGRDFGSEAMRLVAKPNVLILSGEKTYNNEFGQVWFYFDRELEYPVTLLDAGELAGTNLSNFNLIVLPEGAFTFDDPMVEKLNAWISGGGKLIAIGDANRSLEDKKGFNLARFANPSEKEEAQKRADEEALDHRTATYKDRVRSSLPDAIPGAIVRVKMDASHPLAFGLKDYYFSLKTSGLRYDLLKEAWNVGYLEKGFQTNGFIGSSLKRNLENSAVFAVQGKGRGSVIYLVDNPLYRSFWEEGKVLFSNAVFLAN
ncbi:MAG: zinc carboxypeptidase, partial [Bacteroidota bacterium]